MAKTTTEIPPIPEGTTTAELWVKLHEERRMWRETNQAVRFAKDQELAQGIQEAYKVVHMVLGRVCQAFGHERNGEYILEIEQPKGLWCVETNKLPSGNYELRAKEIEV